MRTAIISLIVVGIIVAIGFALRKWGKHNDGTASKGGGGGSSGGGSATPPRDQRPS